MSRFQVRHGVTLRVVIGALLALMIIPLIFFGFAVVSYQRAHAQQERAIAAEHAARAAAERSYIAAENALANADAITDRRAEETIVLDNLDRDEPFSRTNLPYGYRPQSRVVMETHIRKVPVTIHNTETGETETSYREQSVMVPRTVTEYVRANSHGDAVTKIANQLRAMDDDDPKREQQISELKKQLAVEFADQHQRHDEELERAAKRLEKLRELHQQREDKQDQIIDRRVDELLGNPDVLNWGVGGPGPGVMAPGSSGPIGLPGPPQLPRSYVPTPDVAVPPRDTGNPSPGLPQRATTTKVGERVEVETTVRSDLPMDVDASPEFDVPDRPQLSSDSFPAASRQAPTRIAIAAQLDGDVFGIARELSSALLAESAAAEELERATILLDKHALAESEYRKFAVDAEQSKRNALLARARWNALEERLKSEFQFAQSERKRAADRLTETSEMLKNGVASRSDLFDAEAKLEKAEKLLRDIQQQLDQVQQAEEVIGESDSDESRSDGGR